MKRKWNVRIFKVWWINLIIKWEWWWIGLRKKKQANYYSIKDDMVKMGNKFKDGLKKYSYSFQYYTNNIMQN